VKQVMIDLETLGTKPGCVVLEVGAVCFEFGSSERSEFQRSFGIVDQMQTYGLKSDPETVKWWSHPERAPLLLAMEEEPHALTFRDGLAELGFWIAGQGGVAPGIWANSPSFDCSILKEGYERVKLPLPWKYHQERDQRTWLVAAGFARASEVLPAPGGAHRALVDANYQVQVVREVWKRMAANRKGGN